MKVQDFYYYVKPAVPRRLQIALRREIARFKRRIHQHVWPINSEAAKTPNGWIGWPSRKRFALVLSHDVETLVGYNRCAQLMGLEESQGFRSSFNFVPEDYRVSRALRLGMVEAGFETGLHGLKHDGRLFRSRRIFNESAQRINRYLEDWEAVGFTSPSMHRNLEWMTSLGIEYGCSTFDTDPFEPQPEGVASIFPFWVTADSKMRGYVEIPYTLPQDHCLFVILKQRDINIWRTKLDWIAENGGLAFVITHPDYMNFDGRHHNFEEYPANFYSRFLEYIRNTYEGQYWHVLPRDLATFWRENMVNVQKAGKSEKQ